VCNTGLSAEASEALVNILLEGGCPPLIQFHFHNNMSGNGGAFAIARMVENCPTLQDFRYSTTRTSAAGCLKLAEVMSDFTQYCRMPGLYRHDFVFYIGALWH
jgi:Ran GTPase-activating protein 1